MKSLLVIPLLILFPDFFIFMAPLLWKIFVSKHYRVRIQKYCLDPTRHSPAWPWNPLFSGASGCRIKSGMTE